MRRDVWAGVVFFAVLWMAGYGFAASEGYDHKVTAGNMELEWKLNQDTIQIRVAANTDGWVAVGFNPSSRMKDANIVMGYVKNGKVSIADHYGTAERQHEEDTKAGGQTNVDNISGKEANGITEIAFAMPLNSGDGKDQPILADQDNIVLLAYGAGRDSFRTKHVFRTVLKVNFKTGEFSKVK